MEVRSGLKKRLKERLTMTIESTRAANYVTHGTQLRPHKLVPARLADFILRLFFHREGFSCVGTYRREL